MSKSEVASREGMTPTYADRMNLEGGRSNIIEPMSGRKETAAGAKPKIAPYL